VPSRRFGSAISWNPGRVLREPFSLRKGEEGFREFMSGGIRQEFVFSGEEDSFFPFEEDCFPGFMALKYFCFSKSY
jgi:hypothetical protein